MGVCCSTQDEDGCILRVAAAEKEVSFAVSFFTDVFLGNRALPATSPEFCQRCIF